jgi:hypothetical protein
MPLRGNDSPARHSQPHDPSNHCDASCSAFVSRGWLVLDARSPASPVVVHADFEAVARRCAEYYGAGSYVTHGGALLVKAPLLLQALKVVIDHLPACDGHEFGPCARCVAQAAIDSVSPLERLCPDCGATAIAAEAPRCVACNDSLFAARLARARDLGRA